LGLVKIHPLLARLAGWWLYRNIFHRAAYDIGIANSSRQHGGSKVGEWRYAIHEDPETYGRLRDEQNPYRTHLIDLPGIVSFDARIPQKIKQSENNKFAMLPPFSAVWLKEMIKWVNVLVKRRKVHTKRNMVNPRMWTSSPALL
jgi:hypothetical protein